MRVAIQGELGSFHHSAAIRWFGNDIEIVACETFPAVFKAIRNKSADTAIVAIENSLYGSINEVYDLLLKHKIPIVGEVPERIHQCLIGLAADIPFTDITHVYSHPVALGQCSDFLDAYLPDTERIENHDTAASVELIKTMGDNRAVAIAGELAANMHGTNILRKNIQNHDTNFTRFLVLDPRGNNGTTIDKASLVLRTTHQPGALYNALGIFANAGMNLTKLQSRPIPGKVWRYMFYIDVETSPAKLRKAIKQLEALGCQIVELGHYKASA